MFLFWSTHALAEFCESCIEHATQSYLCHLLCFVCSCLLDSSSKLELAHTCSRKGLLGLNPSPICCQKEAANDTNKPLLEA